MAAILDIFIQIPNKIRTKMVTKLISARLCKMIKKMYILYVKQ